MTSDRDDYLTAYRRDGFAIVRGVFAAAEVAEIAGAFDAVRAAGLGLARSFRDKNLMFRLSEDAKLGKTLRMVQWPAYANAVLDRYRLDPRVFEIVAPLVGRDVKQIINQMHWKPPGAAQNSYGFHQDKRPDPDVCVRLATRQREGISAIPIDTDAGHTGSAEA
jgi:hypothetical protein